MDIKIWMMAGTSKSPKIIPIHTVLETNLPTRRMAQNLLQAKKENWQIRR
jgi:hypothetical protein